MIEPTARSAADPPAAPSHRAPGWLWWWHVAWLIVPVVAATVCAWQPEALRAWFPAVTPAGTLMAVSGCVLVLALFGLPAVVARLASPVASFGGRSLVGLREALTGLALVLPGLVAAWKHAPHSGSSLIATVVLLAVVLLAAAAWGVTDATMNRRLSRWLVAVASFAIGLPLVEYVLVEYGQRDPWWLLIANPVWLLADAAPPRPSLANSPLFAPTTLAWGTSIAVAALVAALAMRRWLSAVVALVATCALMVATATSLVTSAPTPSQPVGALELPPPDAGDRSVVRVSAGWTYGAWGGDGYLLPLRAVIDPGDTTGFDGTLVTHGGGTQVHTVIPPVTAGQPAEAMVPAIYLPADGRVLVEARTGSGDPAAVSDLPVPGFPFARGALSEPDSGRGPRPFLAAVIEGRTSLRVGSDSRAERSALIGVKGRDLPTHPALLAPFSAFVLATAGLADVSRDSRDAIADRVRAGALLVDPGYGNDALWRDLLDRLQLAPPGPRDAGFDWTERRAVLELAAGTRMERHELQWLEANRGAGTVVRLRIPRVASEASQRALLRQWLTSMLGPARDPQDSFEAVAGGRLLSGRLFTEALPLDPDRSRPAGSLGSLLFGWALAMALVLLGLRWYGLGAGWSAIGLALASAVVAGVISTSATTRAVDVLECPVIVTRGAPGDTGPARLLRWVRVVATKDIDDPMRVEVAGRAEVLPAATDALELGRLPFHLHWSREGSVAVELGHIRSDEYRLLRVDGWTDGSTGVRVTRGRLEVAAGTRLLGVIQVADFRAAVLADSLAGDSVMLATEPGRMTRYREVAQALRLGEIAPQLDRGDRQLLAVMIEGIVRKNQRFVIAILDRELSPVVRGAGVTETRRPVVLIPLGSGTFADQR